MKSNKKITCDNEKIICDNSAKEKNTVRKRKTWNNSIDKRKTCNNSLDKEIHVIIELKRN